MTIANLKINKAQWEKTAADVNIPRKFRDRAAKNAKIAGERIARKGGTLEAPVVVVEEEVKQTKSKKEKIMADRAAYVNQFNCQKIDGVNVELQAGRTGRPFSFDCTTNVKVGGWFNAAKAQLTFDSAGTGEVTGAASAFNAELHLPNKTMAGGSYAVMEFNLQAQTNTVTHGNPAYPSALAKFKLSGAAKTTWEDANDACLFQIDGFDGGADSVIDLTGAPAGAMAGSIKLLIDGASWYIPIAAT